MGQVTELGLLTAGLKLAPSVFFKNTAYWVWSHYISERQMVLQLLPSK